tara:strand:+ start:2461 stop:8448 length:5988 start_codon:yes stop_codon:yes gene_type:complete
MLFFNIKMIFSKPIIQILALICSILLLNQNVKSQGTIPTVGKDFWLGFMNNADGQIPNTELQLFISGKNATSGTVSLPLQGWSTTFVITPNITTTVTIPNNIAEHFSNDVVDTRGIHVVTLDTVSLFAINLSDYSSDGTKVFPVKSLGTDYIISSYTGISDFGGFKSEFLIVATADGTEIEIIPSVNTLGGNPAGVPYIINLEEGESYQVYAASHANELTGTRVRATDQSGDCRPFAVFAGSQCTNIPSWCSACDHIYDQMYPIELWGSEYYLVPYSGTSGYTYKIIARDNGTNVTIDNGAPIAMTAGQSIEFNAVSGTHYISSNNPIAVIQYMQGTTCSNSGDPAMLVLNADNQRINSVTFSTVTSTIINQHNLNLIVETTDVGTVLLDNVVIPPVNYTSFPSNPTKSYAQLTIAQGSHSLFAPNGFTGYAYGTGNAESYTYSIGSFEPEPELVVDSILCSSDTMVLVPNQGIFSPVWTTFSDTNTVIGTGSSLILIPPIVNDVYIVTGNSFSSGCTQEFLFSVSVPDPPIFTMNTSNDTVCRFNNIQMGVTLSTLGNYQYNWTPAYLFDFPTNSSPILTAEESGWVYVTVSSIGGGCSSGIDSVYIEVLGGGIADLTISTDILNICLPDTAQLSFEVQKVRAYEDFNGGINAAIWASTSGAITSNLCGAINGDALYFNGAVTRIAETTDFDVSLGGNIKFYIKIANGTAPCDDSEFGDDVLLEYSTNGGATWNLFSTLFEFAYPNFTYLSVPIPLAAQSVSTRFRWRQPIFDGADLDVWIMDNVIINAIDNSNLNFTWSPTSSLSNSNIINPLAFPTTSTWYVIDINDAGCNYSDSVYIDVDPGFTLTTSNDTALCVVQEIILNTTPSQGIGYTYVWSPSTYVTNALDGDLSVLPFSTATYYVTVTSLQGCIQDDSVTVYSTGIQVILSADTSICLGDIDTLSALLNLASTDFIYQWFDPNGLLLGDSTTIYISPTVSGNYTFILMDTVSMCMTSDSIFINVGTTFPVITSPDSVYCGTQNVVLSATPGIVGNYTYQWEASPDLTSLTDSVTIALLSGSTSYVVSVTSNAGCTITDTISIVVLGDAGVNIFGDSSVCLGDSVYLTASVISEISDSFEDPVWNPSLWGTISGGALNTDCGSMTGNALHFNGNSRSAETVDLNTSNGGQVNFAIVFGSGVIPCENADNGEDVVLEYSINGGVSWTNMGTYDEAVYTLFTAVSVAIPFLAQTTATRFKWTQISFSGTGNDNWALDDVSIDISTIGNYIYDWYSPSNQLLYQGNVFGFVPDSSGTYSVVASDTNSVCQLFNDQFIQVNEFVVNAGNDTSVCSTLGYNLQGSSGASVTAISWESLSLLDDGSIYNPTILVDSTTTYILSVSEGGCTITDTVLISSVGLTPIFIPNDTLICIGDSFALDLTGATSIIWNPITNILNSASTSPSFIPVVATNYLASYTDINGCLNEDSINVSLNELPIVTLPSDTVFCPGETYLVQSVSNISSPSYLWNTNEITADIIVGSEGVYWIEIITTCGFSLDSIAVSYSDSFFIDLGSDTFLCVNDSLNLVPNIPLGGGITWFDGSNNNLFTVNSPTNVSVIIQDLNGCQVKDSINVDYFEIIPFDLGPDTSLCVGEFAVIGDVSTLVNSYLWSTNESTAQISISTAGIYSLSVIDVNGCPMSDSITVNSLILPIPTIIGPTSFCDYDPVLFVENGVFQEYLWSNGSTSALMQHQGNINSVWVKVTDDNDCVGYDTLITNVVNSLALNLGDDIVLCDEISVNINASVSQADTYLWSTSETSSSIVVGPGIYMVKVNVADCEMRDTIIVTKKNVLFDLGLDYTICDDDVIVLYNPMIEIDSIIWNDGTNTDYYTYTNFLSMYDTITLSAKAYGCGIATDIINIYIEDCSCPVFVPNTFTPNRDKQNNVFKIYNECTLEDFSFMIYDRWGELVFASQSSDFQWNGNFKSSGSVQTGVYVWKMKYLLVNESGKSLSKNKTGHVNVLK